MKGYAIKLTRKDLSDDYFLSGLTTKYNPKKDSCDPTPMNYFGATHVEKKDYANGVFWIFEDKDDAKEFLSLIERFQKLNQILTDEHYFKMNLKISQVEAPKIMYADYDQIIDSLDNFENEMIETSKKLKKYWKV